MAIATVTVTPLTLTEKTRIDLREILDGHKHGLNAILPFIGPALVTSVAYIDPGNFATNIQAGAKYGYSLLWVVIFANLIAMLFQALSAKLGIVTDQNLPELCKMHFPKPVVLSMWVVSEIAAMATELAEFLGGAIGLALLFHIPLIMGMLVIAIITSLILSMGKSGFRPLELIIGGLVIVIALCYLLEMFMTPVNWGSAIAHSVLPQIPDTAALTLSVAIIGATVMPHAIYLHSGLTQKRAPIYNEQDRKKLLRFSHREVIVTLAVAGLINIAMVIMASGAFHIGHSQIIEIESAYHTLTPLLGAGAAGFFLISLIAAGLSSSTVGTMAGQMIMQGFVNFQIPIWIRRFITMAPAFIIIALGVNATKALIFSQVVLSIALPIPMIAVLIFTSRKALMGQFTNRYLTTTAAFIGMIIVLLLNVFLMTQILRR